MKQSPGLRQVWLVVQSEMLRRKASTSVYHRFVMSAGFYFPAALAAFIALVAVVGVWHAD